MKTIKLETNLKLPFLILFLFLSTTTLSAQWGNGGGSWGSNNGESTDTKKKVVKKQSTETNNQNTESNTEPDTTENVDDVNNDDGNWGGGRDMGDFGGFGGNAEPVYVKPPKPPYVRFVAPYDSLREIVLYKGVIEEPYKECEFCTPDSLYFRAKSYLKKRFGKKALKKFTKEDIKDDKLELDMRVPVMVPVSSFVKKQQGEATFKMVLQFRDGRWKYKMYNFIHIMPPNALEKNESTTYFEYYVKSKKHAEVYDKPLVAMDGWVKSTVAELTKAINEPYALKGDALDEEDDW